MNHLCDLPLQVRSELDKIKSDVVKICGYFPSEYEEKAVIGAATDINVDETIGMDYRGGANKEGKYQLGKAYTSILI